MNRKQILELAGTLVTVIAFVWEFRHADQNERIVLWTLFSLSIALLSFLAAGNYLNQKLKQINENTTRINSLEQDLNTAKIFEKVNTRLSRLEGVFDDKLRR